LDIKKMKSLKTVLREARVKRRTMRYLGWRASVKTRATTRRMLWMRRRSRRRRTPGRLKAAVCCRSEASSEGVCCRVAASVLGSGHALGFGFRLSLSLFDSSGASCRPVWFGRCLGVILELELFLLDGFELVSEVKLGRLLLQLGEFVLVF